MYDVEELDNVDVVELFEQRDLADGSAGHTVHFRVETDALEGHHFAGRVVVRLVNNAIRSFANLLNPAEIINA